MSDKIKKLFTEEGKEGVNRYRKSIIDAKRVASGKARDSITSEVTSKPGLVTLTIRALGVDYIKNLELGMTAGEVQHEADEKGVDRFFASIVKWSKDRGIDTKHSEAITSSLLDKGWNTELEGRNATGGTDGVLTDPGNETIAAIQKKIGVAAAYDMLSTLRAELKRKP